MALAQREVGRMKMKEKSEELCPLCGERMQPAQTKKEKEIYFVWYKCLQKNCSGWLVQNPKPLALNWK